MAGETPQPTQEDLEWLRQNPDARSQGFDNSFGAGAAEAALAATGTAPVTAAPEPEPEAAPVAAPAQEAPEAPPEGAAKEEGFWQWVGNGALDVAGAVGHGIQTAVNETVDAVEAFDHAVGQQMDEWGIASQVMWGDGQGLRLGTYAEAAAAESQNVLLGGQAGVVGDGYEIDIMPTPVTALGQATSSVAQFIAGFAGARYVTGATGVLGGFVNGAIADATVFDPDDANLSRFMADNEFAIPLLTEALATDPDDPEWMNRMRNATEGVIAGGLVELTIKGFRAIALGRRAAEAGDAAGQAEARALAEEAADEAQEVIDNGVAPAFRSNRPDAVAQRQAAQEGRLQAYAENAEIDAAVVARSADEAPTQAADDAAEPPAGQASPAPRPEEPAPRAEEPTPILDRAQLEQVLARTEVITPADLDNAISFNFDKMEGPFEGMAVIQAVTDALQETGVAARMGLDQPETLAQTAEAAKREVAEMLNIGTADFTRRLNRLAAEGRDQATMLVAGKTALQSTGRQITRMAEEIERMLAADTLDTLYVDRLFDLMDTHVNIQNSLKAVQTQAARLVSAGRIATQDGLDEAAVNNLMRLAADQRVSARGGAKKASRMVRAIRAAKTPGQRAAVIRQYSKPGWWDVINEVQINSILSGFRTHAVNLTSNAINVGYLPFERIVGGVADGLRGKRGGWDEAAKGVYQYFALRTAVMDAVRLSGRVFRTEQPILDSALKFDHQEGYGRAIRAENFGLESRSIGGRLLNGIGHLARLPGRFLMAEDEFFKQLMFRSRLKANLSVDAARMTPEQLKKLGYNSRGEFIEAEMDRAITSLSDLDAQWQRLVAGKRVADTPEARQAFISQNLGMVNEGSQYARDALRTAREATFTTPVLKGTITDSYMRAVNQHPYLRAITPFIQTPANILSKAFDRLPVLNLTRERYRSRLASPDPAVRAEALGEMATGVAISTGLYMLAVEGRITGGGPQDPRQREIWLNDRNWQPYSINFGTTEDPHWVAINRMDPWATAFGMAGDFSEMMQAAKDDPSFSGANWFSMMAAAVTTNVTSKTYMQGIADFFEVINGGQGGAVAAQSWVNNYISSLVPFSAMQRQGNQAGTPYMQEARTLADRLKQNIIGLSSDLPTRYNWVTGEPQTRPEHLLGYIQVANGSDDAVMSELRRLNYGFAGPDRRIGVIKLSSEQYQDWARLMGTVKGGGGRTLHEALEVVMNSPQYDLDRQRVPDGLVAPEESHRVKAVARTIEGYKAAARAELMKLHPELAEAWIAAERYQGRALQGSVKPGDRDLLQLDFR